MKKRILSIALALALCIGLAIPALAADIKLENPTTVTISIPEVPGLSFTLENVYDVYAFEAGRVEDGAEGYSEEWVPEYKFFFPNHGTVSFNQEITADVGGSALRDGYPEIFGGLRTIEKGEKIEFNGGDASWDAPEGKEFINAVIVHLDDVRIEFIQDYSGSYTLFESVNAGNEIAKPISELVADETTDETTEEVTPETPSSWAIEFVTGAIEAGLVPETLQAKYTTATTRAEFCALAVALYETVAGEEIAERATFEDTTDVNVEKMAALGVVNGTGNGNFSPDSDLTREQAATMLARLAAAMEQPLEEAAPTFDDSESVSSWASDAVGQVQAAGIMSGTGDNKFSPAGAYTREQSIITIMRLFDIVK